MSAAANTTDHAATVAEFESNVRDSTVILSFLKDLLKYHLDETGCNSDGKLVPFCPEGLRDLRAALVTVLRDGAGCTEQEVAAVLAGDFMKD